jgi:hypothetical protein
MIQLLPNAEAWQRSQSSGGTEIDYLLRSTRSLPPRSLEVRLRDGGDVEVCFALAGVRGSPFEQLLTLAEVPPAEAAAVVAEFVGRILNEELVLTMWRGGPFQGGREFVPREDLAGRSPASIRWTASWNGTYDRGLFGA